MNTGDLIQAIFAGACFFAGIVHLLIGIRSQPRDGVHLTFALVSVLYGVYSVNLFLLYAALDSGSLAHYVAVDRWGIASNYLGYAALLLFIAAYTHARKRIVLYAVTGFYAAIAVSCFILPYPWVYTDIELTSSFPPDIIIAPWYRFELVLTPLIFVAYSAYHIVRQYRRGEVVAALALGIALGIYFTTYFYDVGIEYGLIDTVLLQQYGFLAFIVIMSLRLADRIIEAEKKARQLSTELEQRVAKRTAELSEAKSAAESANRAKSVFLANMSHELRTPLNAILGYAQIMFRDPSLKPDQHHFIQAVNRSGDHLLMLINSVLEMSKIEAGQTRLSLEAFDLGVLLKDIQMIFSKRFDPQNLRFKIIREPQIPGIIKSDRGKISQILINLVGNAIRHTHAGCITLNVSTDGANTRTPHLVFEVSDTGEGIDAADLELIFEPFKQSGDDRPQRVGTGLGLAISRQYARILGGDLTVKSRVGEGSVFRLELPLLEADAATMAEQRHLSRRIAGIAGEERALRVLVVDDNPSNRDVLIRLLAPADFEIQEASDGRQAVALFESWSPHLVLMDIRMPTMNGKEAIKKMKATRQGQTVPIIGMSASAFEEDRIQVMQSGADDFIGKPIQEFELWEKVGRLLDVEFQFEAVEAASADASDWLQEVTQTQERLAKLPEELVADMRAAVQGGYMQQMSELVEKVSDLEPALAQSLLKLVERYDYEKLYGLFLQEARK